MSELAAVGEQGPIEKSISARRATAAKLTDRDLLGLFVLTRNLTAAQVHRLVFAGKAFIAAVSTTAEAIAGQRTAYLLAAALYDGNRSRVGADAVRDACGDGEDGAAP